MEGGIYHASQCSRLKALLEFLKEIFDIYSFEHNYVIIKGLFQYE